MESNPHGAGEQRLRSLFLEVDLLLSHLQRLPETRIPRFFEASARPKLEAEGSPLPPTWNLAYFLNRIAAIASAPPHAGPNAFIAPMVARPELAANDPGPQLSDMAFLLWSRDFLAAIVYPASVETIRVTRSFRESRSRRSSWRLDRRATDPTPSDESNKPTAEETALINYGAKLSGRVSLFQWFTVIFIALSVWASFMVFSGRVLMRENDVLQAAGKDLTQRMILADKDERPVLADAFRRAGGAATLQPADYCAMSLPGEAKRGSEPVVGGSVASVGTNVAVPPGSAAATASPDPSTDSTAQRDEASKRIYLLPQQRRLCGERDVLSKRESELKRMHFFWLRSASPLEFLVLKLPALPFQWMFPSLPEPSTEAKGRDMGTRFEGLDLATHKYGMEQMVDGLIGAVLPVAYSCLGALAALFRRIGRKVETETLGPADFGGMRTTLVLGVLTGTVVGLFSDVMDWGDHHDGVPLSTTALALLAGFASDRVFVMLDALADRVFGRAEGAHGTDDARLPRTAATIPASR